MKRSIFLLGLALTAYLSSCTDDDLGYKTVENPVRTGDEILFGSSLSDNVNMVGKTVTSRTVYGERTETGVPVYWQESGDSIAIFCLQSSQPANHLVNYVVKPVLDENGDPTATAASVTKSDLSAAGLQWGDPDKEHRFYAFYPARAVEDSKEDADASGLITANIPVTQQVQEWREGVFTSTDPAFNRRKVYFGLPNMDYAYMYAYNAVTPSKVEKNSLINLQFQNLVTVLDITVQGPTSGSATITNINVDAIEGEQPILTGDFTCRIRDEENGEVKGTCHPIGDFNEERGRISIPCYDKKTGKFVTLKQGELLNVKAYIIPQDVENTVTQHTLRITVSMLNGAPCKKTLNTADVTPHKINRVVLPPLQVGGTNYWMSSLDPDIYVTELSIPGSKFSVLTSDNKAANVYQNVDIETQFKDGVRAFIFQTATKGDNSNPGISGDGGAFNKFTYKGFYVVSETKDKTVMQLSEAITSIASYLDKCEQAGKKNEFAFVMLTYTDGDYYLGSWTEPSVDREQFWLEKLRDEVNAIAGVATNRIYTEKITPETTIDDVKGKIILKANYNSQNMINDYGSTTAPIMFTYWGSAYGPKNTDGTYYQDTYGGMPMDWGIPKWYENSDAKLKWYYQEVTSVGTDKEALRTDKEAFIKKLFTESVTLYEQGSAHNTWFMNDLGGYYSDATDINNRGTGIQALAIDMNDLGVTQLQNRTENAGLGLIFMNFADKQTDSGVKYKSDWLIQTIIDNNFKFALRKAGSTTLPTTRTEYVTRMGSDGWDE